MNKYVFYSVLVLLMSFCRQALATDVVFGGSETSSYYYNVLKHALAYFPEKNYQVTHVNDKSMGKARRLKMLETNQKIDVLSGTATAQRENQFQAIYFPLLKGLKGWRLPLINKKSPELFAQVNSLDEFKKLVPAQFHSWTAAKILEHNGVKVTKAYNHQGVILMLDKERVDYIPRSILDVSRILSRYQDLNLMLDPHVIIKYPNAYYFYVNKNNKALAQDIMQGLEMALHDGSFDQLFRQTYGPIISQFNLQNRKVIQLTNPYLLTTMPVQRAELWADNLLN